MRDSTVLIIGAGIGGLTAALALLRSGQRVRVFEQATEAGEVGAGLTITPNAGRALASLGLRARLEAVGSTPAHGALRHYATGETLVALPQDRSREQWGIPLYHVHRADLHALLLEAVLAIDGDCLRVGKSLVTVRQEDSSVRAGFADGSTAQGEWLVGCDGIRSQARAILFGPDAPHFTGYVAWRALVPGSRVTPDLLDPPLCMTIGPGRLLMRYPLRGGSLVNYVALARHAAWTEEGWTARSEVAELLAEFAGFDAHARRLLELTPPDRCYKWGLFDREPLASWACGRATLLGDAAHAMPPFTGQGAAMAIEDGVVLGRAAAAAADVGEALARYQRTRYRRVTDGLAMSRARATSYFADDPGENVRALGAAMAQVRSLYSYDAASVEV